MPTKFDDQGHVLGNFHAYYTFNPALERLRFLSTATCQRLQQKLLSAVGDRGFVSVLDVGCNEGDLTIGLYDKLTRKLSDCSANEQQPPPAQTDKELKLSPSELQEDLRTFDNASVSQLNELVQREKRAIEYRFEQQQQPQTQEDRRPLFRCELLLDSQRIATAKGVSKRVAKAKAASVALIKVHQSTSSPSDDGGDADKQKQSQPPPQDQHHSQSLRQSQSHELMTERLFVLGVDVDDVLIDRATDKSKAHSGVCSHHVLFRHVDIMKKNAFDQVVEEFFESAAAVSTCNDGGTPINPKDRKFSLITCFSVTMWIHLNHGDDGLFRFLELISQLTDHLILEPQPYKCYRNAIKRLERLRKEIPRSFHQLKLQRDVVEKIDSFLMQSGRFRFKTALGTTNWSRQVILYSRSKF